MTRWQRIATVLYAIGAITTLLAIGIVIGAALRG